jgi:hypothetical protein
MLWLSYPRERVGNHKTGVGLGPTAGLHIIVKTTLRKFMHSITILEFDL